ncbi:MAG: PAS domain S-box protein [Hyphomicrobiales bacterium]|nr:MAG: PAS domain S-box protein [Hyphomicrobiales bacterium]
MMMDAKAQIVIFAGDDLVAIYNDDYARAIGGKHPSAFGRPANLYWSELWADLEPLLLGVLTTGTTFSEKNRAFYIERHGYPETVCFDVSYSALRDCPDAPPCAVLCIVSETTEIVRARAVERRLAAIVSSTDAAILGTDLDLVVTSWNGGAEKLYGYREAEMIGQSVTRLLPADRQDEDDYIMRQIRNGVRVEPHDTVRIHKDGSLIDVSLTVSPILGEDGEIIGASKISRNIADRKAAERMQAALVAEMLRRVKNIIISVQSIARHTFGSGDHVPQLQIFSERLAALARSQDLITLGGLDGIDLQSLIEEVVAPYRGDAFSIDGPPVLLQAQSALAFALAIHELATNAAKYGALSEPGGKVAISWTAADSKFRFLWTESGGPPVSKPDRTGFGSVVIERVLGRELGGKVTRTFLKSGMTCLIDVKLGRTGKLTTPDQA